MRKLVKIFSYLWVLPCSLIGLVLALIFYLFGARIRVFMGVLEVSGGWMWKKILQLKWWPAIAAFTLGHVIIGTSNITLESLRAHEHIHVKQYQHWGLLFIPLYIGSSVYQWIRGRDPYRNNYFEREAFARNSQSKGASKNS